MAKNSESWGRDKAKERYADGGSVRSVGGQPQPRIGSQPRQQIRDHAHLQRLLSNAEGDKDLQRIKRMGERQGLDTSTWGVD